MQVTRGAVVGDNGPYHNFLILHRLALPQIFPIWERTAFYRLGGIDPVPVQQDT